MSNIKNYPITLDWMEVWYPTWANGHTAVDYGTPQGTPLNVRGYLLGYSGSTGNVTGPHVHIDKTVNGQRQNPKDFDTFVGSVHQVFNNGQYNGGAGNYVVLKHNNGALYRFLHMDRTTARVGDKIGAQSPPTTPKPPTSPKPPSKPKYKTITIQWGDTLWDLAQTYNTTVGELMKLNPYIEDPNVIYAGNNLKVPA